MKAPGDNAGVWVGEPPTQWWQGERPKGAGLKAEEHASELRGCSGGDARVWVWDAWLAW